MWRVFDNDEDTVGTVKVGDGKRGDRNPFGVKIYNIWKDCILGIHTVIFYDFRDLHFKFRIDMTLLCNSVMGYKKKDHKYRDSS